MKQEEVLAAELSFLANHIEPKKLEYLVKLARASAKVSDFYLYSGDMTINDSLAIRKTVFDSKRDKIPIIIETVKAIGDGYLPKI